MKFSRVLALMSILFLFSFQSVSISEDASIDKIDITAFKALKTKYDSRIQYPIPHLLEKYNRNESNSEEFETFATKLGFSADGFKVQVVFEFDENIENLITPNVIDSYDIAEPVKGAKWLKGFIPVFNLQDFLTQFPQIKLVRQPRLVEKTATTTEGFAHVNGPTWHTAGYTGAGVKVAIIDSGFQHISTAIGTGDFTSSYTSRDFTGSGFPGSGDHGTECASIVYDFVPDATFYLIVIADDGDFELAKNYCISNGIDVISMSLGWLGYWYGDGQGGVSDIANELASNGILLVNSAGNNANYHFWTGSWNDADADDLLDISGGDETNSIQISSGERVDFRLTWDTSLNNSDQDYDLYLLDSTMSVVASSVNDQTGTQQPIELVAYTAPSTGTYHVVINKYSANGTSNFRLFCTKENALEYASTAQSILEPGTAPGSFTVGAIAEYSWNSSPVPIEYFSSRGPTSDGRVKPDICGPDGTTAQYGSGRFYGTSGACPHVAGAAAIVWSSKLSYTATQVRTYLENNAIDCGTAGKDSTFGYGKLELGVPGPDKVVLINPPNNSVDQPTSINFQWQQPAGSPTAYQLQVSTDSGFSSTFYDNSSISATAQVVSGMAVGVKYYWRVRASNGYWGDWSDTWNFTTVIPPGPVSLISPADKSTNQTLSINFQWQQPSVGTQPFSFYQLQVSVSNTFTSSTYDNSSISSTSQQVMGLSYNTTYYWRVRAYNIAGWGQWSSIWEFKTIEPPGQVTLSSPTNGVLGQPATISCQWNVPTGLGPLTYQLQISTSSTFTTTFYDNAGVASNSLQVMGLLYDTMYYWRVRASNVAGWGLWSNTWNFETIITPGQVTLHGPTNNAMNQATTLNLQWNLPTTGTAPFTYQLQVASDDSFNKIIYDNSGIGVTSQQITGLLNGSSYFWRVRANNPAGWGVYSAEWKFTTELTPVNVVLISPADDSTDLQADVNFSWNEPAFGTQPITYQLQVSTDNTFSAIIFDKDNISLKSHLVTGLSYDTTYFWRVIAKNAVGPSDYSDVWQFTTAITPGTINLVSPKDKIDDQLATLTFEWEKSTVGTLPLSYHIQIAKDSSFSAIFYENDNVSNTNHQVVGLNYNSTYYWRVRAKNIAGWGSFSSARSFSTIVPPNKIDKISPFDESELNTIALLFVWYEPTAGTTPFVYQIQISTENNFTNIIYDNDSLTNQSVRYEDLEYKTTYYWRVRAQNDAGWGDWSDSWMFTIKSKPSDGCSFSENYNDNELNTFWLAIIFIFALVAIRRFKH